MVATYFFAVFFLKLFISRLICNIIAFVFDGVEVVTNITALEGEEDFMNDMNAESELNFNNNGDSRVQKIVEAADAGIPYEELIAEWTQAWNDAQESLGIEVLY